MTKPRRFSITLFAVLVLTIFLLCVCASAAENACDGCTLGTFYGSPACTKDGKLHLCQNNFPDANFRAVVAKTISQAENSFLSQTKVNEVKEIHAGSKSCTSLDGVGFFANLEYLYCGWNNLTALDVSKNTKLTILKCNHNQLTSLDVKNQPNLRTLSCYSNQLTELDLTKNTRLTELHCLTNQLKVLDLSQNVRLTRLYCESNQLSELKINSPKLTELSCADNLLTALDVSSSPLLQHLHIHKNRISSFDTSNLSNLLIFSCSSNQLSTLDVSNSPKLHSLSCDNNKLTSIVFHKNSRLSTISCTNNNLTVLDLTNCSRLYSVYCLSNPLTAIDFSNCTQLTILQCDLQNTSLHNFLSDIAKLSNTLETVKISISYSEPYYVRNENSPSQFDIGQIVGKENLPNIQSVTCNGPASAQYNPVTGIFPLPHGVVELFIHYGISLANSKTDSIRINIIVPCTHTWTPGSCTQPSRCAHCGEENGGPLPHYWLPATKTEPMTCEGCHITSGHPLEHVWKAADCLNAKRCFYCSETDGSPLGHKWKSSDCSEGKYCLRCNRTDPTPIEHQWVAQTYCTSNLRCKNCSATKPSGKEHNWVSTSFFLPSYCTDCPTKEGSSYLNQFLFPIVTAVDLIYLHLAAHWIRNYRKIKKYPDISPKKRRKS